MNNNLSSVFGFNLLSGTIENFKCRPQTRKSNLWVNRQTNTKIKVRFNGNENRKYVDK